VPGALTQGIRRPGREADHSPSSSTEVKNAWSYTSTPSVLLHGVVLVKQRDSVAFYLNLHYLVLHYKNMFIRFLTGKPVAGHKAAVFWVRYLKDDVVRLYHAVQKHLNTLKLIRHVGFVACSSLYFDFDIRTSCSES
jgi:hypothetical protein